METIKKEKKADLEQLLNSLIEKGWKPFGWEVREAKKGSYNNLYYGFDSHPELYHIRMLVSKESNLWQFVCENGMINDKDLHERIKDIYEYDDGLAWKGIDYKKGCNSLNYEYRLIESSLKDESELEDFLLSNIKVDEKDNM